MNSSGHKFNNKAFNLTVLLKLPSKRELEILDLISWGFANPEIAEELFISVHTVDKHRKNLMKKLNVSNTALLLRKAFQFGLIS